MSTATFSLFPKLEKSLRLKIWEDACFQRARHRPGLHYIKLDENRQLAPLNCSWQATGPKNRSAYLWHAGLWMACKESRKVAVEHWREQNWPDLQARIKGLDLGDAIWFSSETLFSKTGLIHRRGDYEPWRQVVDGFWDAFFITADSWEPLIENWNPIRLEADDEWGDGHKHYLMDIGVEFDPSWNLQIVKLNPESPFSDYPPSLAFLIRILLDLADKNYFLEIVYLLDKNVLWRHDTHGRYYDQPIFSDCDHQYIELSSCSNLDEESPFSFFLKQLDKLLGAKLTIIQYGTTELRDVWGLPIELTAHRLIRPVVRLDNYRADINGHKVR
ncbi:hypothetical protein FGRMN_6456 [Fusarium graminum]|nr:hypothetical protein FGRMN_6456 [Fusarium graminum]